MKVFLEGEIPALTNIKESVIWNQYSIFKMNMEQVAANLEMKKNNK